MPLSWNIPSCEWMCVSPSLSLQADVLTFHTFPLMCFTTIWKQYKELSEKRKVWRGGEGEESRKSGRSVKNGKVRETCEEKVMLLFGQALLRVIKKGSMQTNSRSDLMEGGGGGEMADYWLNGRIKAVKGLRDAVCVAWTGPGWACDVMMEILHSLKTSLLTFSSAGPLNQS